MRPGIIKLEELAGYACVAFALAEGLKEIDPIVDQFR